MRRLRSLPKGDNYRPLDPAAPLTRSLIKAMLAARDPLPWTATEPPEELPPLAALAKRIEERAKAGKTVRLTPETARRVAAALYLTADGPVPWTVLQDYGYRLVEYPTDGPGEVIAYCRNLDAGIGAYEAAVRAVPGRRLALRWGQFSPRKNFR